VAAASENDPWASLEAEAEDLLGGDGGDGDHDPEGDDLLDRLRGSGEEPYRGLVKRLRGELKRIGKKEQEAEQRGYARGKTETAAAIQREALFAQHAVPARLRAAFSDIEPADAEGFARRIGELAADGITWKRPDSASSPTPAGEQPDTSQTAQPADPGLIVSAFQQAAAMGVPGHAGDVLSRVAQAGLGQIQTAQDAQGFEAELNAQIAALGQQRRAGSMG
jgi:hypothetical protein